MISLRGFWVKVFSVAAPTATPPRGGHGRRVAFKPHQRRGVLFGLDALVTLWCLPPSIHDLSLLLPTELRKTLPT